MKVCGYGEKYTSRTSFEELPRIKEKLPFIETTQEYLCVNM